MSDDTTNTSDAADATTTTAGSNDSTSSSSTQAGTIASTILPLKPAPVTADQLRHVGAAVAVDVLNQLTKLKAKVTPATWDLLQRVCQRAVEYRVALAVTPADDKAAKKLVAMGRAVDSQLANLKVAAAVLTNESFWAIVDAVINRLTTFAVGAVVSAL